VPRPLPERGLYVVDGSWGTLQPMRPAPGVRTVAELEVIEHIRSGLTVVDTRAADAYEEVTIPTAINIPHAEASARAGELDRSRATIFFCNGPLCAATGDEIRALRAAGYPAEAMLYYRGGLHDWITVGLPVVRPVLRSARGRTALAASTVASRVAATRPSGR
jgi:rhodanese-related sulfurtransferase